MKRSRMVLLLLSMAAVLLPLTAGAWGAVGYRGAATGGGGSGQA